MKRALIGMIVALLVGFVAGYVVQENYRWIPPLTGDRVPERVMTGPLVFWGDQTVVINGTWVSASEKTSATYPYVRADRLPWETSEIMCSKNEMVCREITASVNSDDRVLRIRHEGNSPIKSWDSDAIVTEENGPIPICVTVVTRYDLKTKEAVRYIERKTPQELANLPTLMTENCDLAPQRTEMLLSGGRVARP